MEALLVAPSGGYQTMRKHARSWVLVWAMTSLVAWLSWCSTTSSMQTLEQTIRSNPDVAKEKSENPSITTSSNEIDTGTEALKSEEELLAELLTTQINFNGKEKPMSPLIKLVKSETPGNYNIKHPDIEKVTLESLEINSKGELITKKFLITIDGLDVLTSIYAKKVYGIRNRDICTVEEWKNEKWMRVFYVTKMSRR